jgi:hypothetical protein
MEVSTYTLELPTALQVVPTFHVLLLWLYYPSDNVMFPNRVQPEPYNFGTPDNQEWFVNELLGHQWTNGKNLEFEVWWSLGDTTREPLSSCKDLETLDCYLELQGVKHPAQLPKHT